MVLPERIASLTVEDVVRPSRARQRAVRADRRLIFHPMRRRARRTRAALVAGQVLTPRRRDLAPRQVRARHSRPGRPSRAGQGRSPCVAPQPRTRHRRARQGAAGLRRPSSSRSTSILSMPSILRGAQLTGGYPASFRRRDPGRRYRCRQCRQWQGDGEHALCWGLWRAHHGRFSARPVPMRYLFRLVR
jgi:hypothetical protein